MAEKDLLCVRPHSPGSCGGWGCGLGARGTSRLWRQVSGTSRAGWGGVGGGVRDTNRAVGGERNRQGLGGEL